MGRRLSDIYPHLKPDYDEWVKELEEDMPPTPSPPPEEEKPTSERVVEFIVMLAFAILVLIVFSLLVESFGWAQSGVHVH